MRDHGHVPLNAGHVRCDMSIIAIRHEPTDLKEWRRRLREKGARERELREREEAARQSTFDALYAVAPEPARRKPSLDAADPQEVAKQYESMSMDALAREYGVERRTLKEWMEDHDIAIRAKGQRIYDNGGDVERILTLHRQGKSSRQIAAELKVGRNRVCRVVKEASERSAV